MTHEERMTLRRSLRSLLALSKTVNEKRKSGMLAAARQEAASALDALGSSKRPKPSPSAEMWERARHSRDNLRIVLRTVREWYGLYGIGNGKQGAGHNVQT